MKTLIQKTRIKAGESQTGKGEVSKASLICIGRGGVQIWEARKGCPNARLVRCRCICILRKHVLSGFHGYRKHNARAQPANGCSTRRVVGLQAGDRASMEWGAQEADGCPFFYKKWKRDNTDADP